MGSGGHIIFNSNTLALVDRVIVLRINTEEMQIETLLNLPVAEAINLMTSDGKGKHTLSLFRLIKKPVARVDIKSVSEVVYQDMVIRELENGSIEVERSEQILIPVKPVLRDIAVQLNIGLLNGNGNPLNTRQLGSQIIKNIKEFSASLR